MYSPQAVVLTISDSASRGEREDLSGPAAKAFLEGVGCVVLETCVVPDELELIRKQLILFAERGDIDLVVTTGGTGLSPRDVTPEATAQVIEKEVPGLAELMRWEGRKSTPMAVLSRAKAGIRAKTLLLNLPGSVRGVRECLEALAPVLFHALDLVSGKTVRCGG